MVRLGSIHERRLPTLRAAQVYLSQRPFVDYLRTIGLAAGATHVNSWSRSADLKTVADRYVVTPNNASIGAYGLVDVSVEPVVISVPALPSAR
jgi:hypothetical protein